MTHQEFIKNRFDMLNKEITRRQDLHRQIEKESERCIDHIEKASFYLGSENLNERAAANMVTDNLVGQLSTLNEAMKTNTSFLKEYIEKFWQLRREWN